MYALGQSKLIPGPCDWAHLIKWPENNIICRPQGAEELKKNKGYIFAESLSVLIVGVIAGVVRRHHRLPREDPCAAGLGAAPWRRSRATPARTCGVYATSER